MGKAEKRTLLLANYLYELRKGAVSLKDVSKELNLTVRILKECIYNYNFLELDECGLSISLNDETEIECASDGFSLNRLEQLLVRRNHLFILCKTLFENDFSSLEEFSESNYTSVSTMYRKIVSLKELLKEYEIELDLSNHVFFWGKNVKSDIFFSNSIF